MGTVIPMNSTRAARARGAGLCAALAAQRHGIDAEHAAGFALAARDLVLAGCSAAMALAKVYQRIRREAAATGTGPRAA